MTTCSSSTSRTRTFTRSSATAVRLPYFNSLLPHGSELGNFFAEEHPSDANYLALAGGSAFGIPLDDPLEYDSQYTIHARNIGDLVDAAHETWRAYKQSAAGPCDDTVHGYYWDDDLPLLYFSDIRQRPGLLRRARPAAWSRWRPTSPARRRRPASSGSAPTTATTWRDAASAPATASSSRSWARSCARPRGGPSGRWPSSPGTRTTTTMSNPRNGCRRSSSAPPGSSTASSRRSATPTTASCARSRARWGWATSPPTTSTPSRSTTSSPPLRGLGRYRARAVRRAPTAFVVSSAAGHRHSDRAGTRIRRQADQGGARPAGDRAHA